MGSQSVETRTVRCVLLGVVLAAPVYGPCDHAPRPENHLTRAYKPLVPPAERPQAVTPKTEHRFGTMEPGGAGTHQFTVRNEGSAPLTLTLPDGPAPEGGFRVEIVPGSIPPGEKGTVRVTWKTAAGAPLFSREVTVKTDDPFRPQISFKIEGIVRVMLAADPLTVSFAELDPQDTAVSRVTTVFSQVWDRFTVADVTCSLAGATWTLSPAGASALEACEAKSGWQLQLTTPPDMPGGPFQGVLRITATPASSADGAAPGAETFEVPFHGRVLRRLALYGTGLEPSGELDVGYIRPGQGLQHRLLMKVRDPEQDVRVAAIRAQPEFLKVRIEALPERDATCGLYQFTVEVPPDAPQCVYRGRRPGSIHVDVDHPRLEDLDLKVFFAVWPTR